MDNHGKLFLLHVEEPGQDVAESELRLIQLRRI